MRHRERLALRGAVAPQRARQDRLAGGCSHRRSGSAAGDALLDEGCRGAAACRSAQPAQTGQTEKQGGLPDSRVGAAFEVARFAEAIRPTAILVEQAANFLRVKEIDGRLLLALRSEFLRLGCDMHIDVLDASDYGMAQRRRCAVIAGVPTGQLFGFPFPTQEGARTVGEAFAGLPAPSVRREKPAIANHIDVTPCRGRQRISYVPEGLRGCPRRPTCRQMFGKSRRARIPPSSDA